MRRTQRIGFKQAIARQLDFAVPRHIAPLISTQQLPSARVGEHAVTGIQAVEMHVNAWRRASTFP